MAVATIGLCLLTGCETTGFSSRERSGVTYPNYILGMQSVSTNAARRELHLPLRLAVAQVGEAAPPNSMIELLETNRAIASFVVGLPAPGDNSSTRLLANKETSQFQDYSEQARSLCRLAQSAGADYLFLVGGNIDTWNDPSFLKVFDITLVGGFIIPSTGVKGYGKAAGTLVDVATGAPVLFASVESSNSDFVPSNAVWEKRDAVSAQLRKELGAKLAAELVQKLPGAVQTAAAR
jgi:hypothetical protein